VLSQTTELEALEARLKATEERLKQRQSMGYTGMSLRGSPSPRRRAPLGDTFSPPAEGEEPQQRNQTSPLVTEFRPKTPTRPQTGKREPSYTNSSAPPMPGALPPTPGTSEGESTDGDGEEDRASADYVVVPEDGDLPPPVPPPRSSHRSAS
jgi:hypothetical protein